MGLLVRVGVVGVVTAVMFALLPFFHLALNVTSPATMPTAADITAANAQFAADVAEALPAEGGARVRHVTANGATFSVVEYPAHNNGVVRSKSRGDRNVVMLHGFPDNALTFYKQLEFFSKQGFNAYSITLRGFEPATVRADGDYYMSSLVDDFEAQLTALGIKRCHIVAHDIGVMVATLAAGRNPQRIQSLQVLSMTLNLSEGFWSSISQLRNFWYIYYFQLPALAERWLTSGGGVRDLWQRWSPDRPIDEPHMARVQRSLAAPGVMHATLQHYRCMFAVTLAAFTPSFPQAIVSLMPAALQRSVRELHDGQTRKILMPVKGVIGLRDQCMDADLWRHCMRLNHNGIYRGSSTFQEFKDAGHWVHLEEAHEVNHYLIKAVKGFQNSAPKLKAEDKKWGRQHIKYKTRELE